MLNQLLLIISFTIVGDKSFETNGPCFSIISEKLCNNLNEIIKFYTIVLPGDLVYMVPMLNMYFCIYNCDSKTICVYIWMSGVEQLLIASTLPSCGFTPGLVGVYCWPQPQTVICWRYLAHQQCSNVTYLLYTNNCI